MSAVGIGANERSLIRVLLELGPSEYISEKSLAYLAGVPRTTLRRYIDSAIGQGLMDRRDTSGISITYTGYDACVQLTAEVFAICFEGQVGFSEDFVLKTAAIQAGYEKKERADVKRMRMISFPLPKFKLASKNNTSFIRKI
jgi:hypothetical protein